MTIVLKKRRPRRSVTPPALVEADVMRLLLLSLPPGYRVRAVNIRRKLT
jgi:hypothetical protein